jgi:hypothetical protein
MSNALIGFPPTPEPREGGPVLVEFLVWDVAKDRIVDRVEMYRVRHETDLVFEGWTAAGKFKGEFQVFLYALNRFQECPECDGQIVRLDGSRAGGIEDDCIKL